MNIHKESKSIVRGGKIGYFLGIVTIVAGTLFVPAANAACGSASGRGSSASIGEWAPTNIGDVQSGLNQSIVGLWHVTYTANQQLFYEAFDMWHSDGTEVETANLSPAEGNFCMGVWKQVSATVHLSHVGWGFDNLGNPVGMFTLNEINSVKSGNSYQGTFVYKAYDLNGNVVQEISGTLAATRITPN